MKNKALTGLRKKGTYNSLVNYLDGGQETIKYPDRLATQLKNSHQMSNLVDSEGKSWFEENKAQMRNFTEQQVKELVIKQNLQPHQTFQTQKIIEQGRQGKPRQPKETQRHENGLSHTATPQPQVYDMVSKDLDEKMEQQNDDIEAQYAFKKEQEAEKKKDIAQRFKMDLGEELPPYQKAFNQKKTKYDKSYSSTDKPDPDKDPEAAHEPKGKRGRPPKPKETVVPSIEATHEPKGKAGRPPKVLQTLGKPKDKAKAKAVAFEVDDEEMTEKERKKRENELPSPQKGQRKKRNKPTQEQANEDLRQLIDAMPKTKKEEEKPQEKTTIKRENKKFAKDYSNVRPQIAPTHIGIQRIRELFLEAKHRGKIPPSVYLDYEALYESWKGNKGNPGGKAADLKKLRELYTEHIYKK